ncbi:MAG TPA: serine/threonine protein kinase [Armatimonadota bacterium]|nr:serine/threonine protein kinase [Armatimonadota bacterium]
MVDYAAMLPALLLAFLALAPPIAAQGDGPDAPPLTDWVFFASDGRLGAIRPDGTGECYPDFALPTQRDWRMGYVSPDGREAELYSLESGKCWRYDFVAGTIAEIERRRGTPLRGGERYLHESNEENLFSLFTTDLQGENRREVYSATGFAYGIDLSPDGRKVAFHITNHPARPGYEIYVVDIASGESTFIASDWDYLHFAPRWSQDGQWLLYQRCEHKQDPGHDRSDICLSRADGSEHRLLTTGQRHWFAAAIGTPERHSSGSNVPVWSPDGRSATGALLLPGSRTAWPYATDRPDLDHFNRDYHPELARGGTEICQIDVETGEVTVLAGEHPPTWCFRPAWSPDGSKLAYMRADVGGLPELWVMGADGGDRRRLTGGLNGTGADHARWVRLAAETIGG